MARYDAISVMTVVAGGLVVVGAGVALSALLPYDHPNGVVPGREEDSSLGTVSVAWAESTFIGIDDEGATDPDRTLEVALTVRGEVVVRPRGDEELLDLFRHGGARNGSPRDGPDVVTAAFPDTFTTLASRLATGLMLTGLVFALLRDRVQPLWPLVGAAALALLVVGVLLRHLAVAALGSWTESLNLAEIDTVATGMSGRPVVGAGLALAGAVVGTFCRRPAPRAASG